jgi:hypothetical protein
MELSAKKSGRSIKIKASLRDVVHVNSEVKGKRLTSRRSNLTIDKTFNFQLHIVIAFSEKIPCGVPST